MVAVSGVGQSQTTVGGQHSVGSPMDTDGHTVAPPLQPYRENPTTAARHEALHSTPDITKRWPVPLPDHTSAGRKWQTSTSAFQRETGHDTEVAGRPPSVRTVAIPKEVPRVRRRRTRTPSTSQDEGTDDGFRWTTHSQHDTRRDRVPSEQSIRQHMAYPISYLAIGPVAM